MTGISIRVDTPDGHVTRDDVVHFTVGAGQNDPVLTYADGSNETIEGGLVRYGEIEEESA